MTILVLYMFAFVLVCTGLALALWITWREYRLHRQATRWKDLARGREHNTNMEVGR